MYELVRDVSVVKAGTKGLMDRLRLKETSSEIRVGRTSANQMRLQPEGKESMGLSRYHARLVRMKKKDGWMLVDNKSTNGTYVNSIKIAQLKPVELVPNDVIVFGGGGSQAVGGRKRQRTSPFRFFYRKCQDCSESSSDDRVLSKMSEKKPRPSSPLESRETISNSYEENTPSEKKSPAIVNQLADTITCAICMEFLVHSVNLPCGHSCCWMCWDEWSEKNRTCPTCRKEVEDEKNIVRNICCDQMVELFVNQDNYSKEEKQVFKERKAESEKFMKAKKRARSSKNSTMTRSSSGVDDDSQISSEKKKRRRRNVSVVQ